MFIVLLHLGDLGLLYWLAILFAILAAPALFIGGIALAVYKIESARKRRPRSANRREP